MELFWNELRSFKKHANTDSVSRMSFGHSWIPERLTNKPRESRRTERNEGKTAGQRPGLCSSREVVWETLRPSWEVFSSEMEGDFPVLFPFSDCYDIQWCPFHPKFRRSHNEEWGCWEAWSDMKERTVKHLLSNHQTSHYHYNEEVAGSSGSWASPLIGWLDVVGAITRINGKGRLANLIGSRLFLEHVINRYS